MLDHISLPVTDLPRSVAWYTAALAPLGCGVVMQFPATTGFGRDGKPYFWIAAAPAGSAIAPVHVAFTAADRAAVDAFHAAARAAGGADNGAPGLRPHYHRNYYGAFVRDPDGHNIEAVCHQRVMPASAAAAAPAPQPGSAASP